MWGAEWGAALGLRVQELFVFSFFVWPQVIWLHSDLQESVSVSGVVLCTTLLVCLRVGEGGERGGGVLHLHTRMLPQRYAKNAWGWGRLGGLQENIAEKVLEKS